VEVINAGVNGYNTAQEIALLRRVGLRMQPDLVILGFTPNDIMTADEGKAMLHWPVLKETLARSALYQFAAPRVKALVLRGAGRAYTDTLSMFIRGDSGLKSRAEVIATGFGELARLGATHGFRPMVLLFPFAQQVHPAAEIRWPPAPIAMAADGNGIPLLDLLPAYLAAEQRGDSLFLDEPTRHPNPYGQHLAAREVYEFVRDHGLMPPCVFESGALAGSGRRIAGTR
jgi:lysophospholipase L1-like esterase